EERGGGKAGRGGGGGGRAERTGGAGGGTAPAAPPGRPSRPPGPRQPAGKAAASDSGADSGPAAESTTRPRRAEGESVAQPIQELTAGTDAGLPGADELIAAIKTFTSLDDGRQAFRMVWASRKLAENEIALDAAIELARRAIQMAEAATEPEGSMRDAPLLDRQGRLEVFRGRAEDALGWALLKKGDTRHAIDHLTKSA